MIPPVALTVSRRLYDALNAGPVYAFLLSPAAYDDLLTEVDRDVPGTKDKGSARTASAARARPASWSRTCPTSRSSLPVKRS